MEGEDKRGWWPIVYGGLSKPSSLVCRMPHAPLPLMAAFSHFIMSRPEHAGTMSMNTKNLFSDVQFLRRQVFVYLFPASANFML